MLNLDKDADALDLLADNIDPTKIKVQTATRYLDRKIEITLSSSDDVTFNALADAIEVFKKIYEQEMARLSGQHSSP